MHSDVLSLGVIGSALTFAGKAAEVLRALHPSLGEPRYYPSGGAMMAALLRGEVDAIVGAQASSVGGVTGFGDLLARPESKLYVIYEKAIPFGCCLLGKPGAHLHGIRVVYGGPASLPLAREFIAANLPQAQCERYSSSSGIAAQIASGDGVEAMLGTRGLAEQSGLAILAENIDGPQVSGNWWVLSSKPLLSPEPRTVLVSFRGADDGGLGQLVSRLAAVGYVLSTVAAQPTGTGLLEFDHLLRLHGVGRTADVRAAIEAAAGARLAGAWG